MFLVVASPPIVQPGTHDQRGVASALREDNALERRASQLTRERDAALFAARIERERCRALLRECDALALEVFKLRHGAAPPWKPVLVGEQSRQLDFAVATIRNMERSWFWRLRVLWLRLKSAFGCSARPRSVLDPD